MPRPVSPVCRSYGAESHRFDQLQRQHRKFAFKIGAYYATAFNLIVYSDANDWSQASVPVAAGTGVATDDVFTPFQQLCDWCRQWGRLP